MQLYLSKLFNLHFFLSPAANSYRHKFVTPWRHDLNNIYVSPDKIRGNYALLQLMIQPDFSPTDRCRQKHTLRNIHFFRQNIISSLFQNDYYYYSLTFLHDQMLPILHMLLEINVQQVRDQMSHLVLRYLLSAALTYMECQELNLLQQYSSLKLVYHFVTNN